MASTYAEKLSPCDLGPGTVSGKQSPSSSTDALEDFGQRLVVLRSKTADVRLAEAVSEYLELICCHACDDFAPPRKEA